VCVTVTDVDDRTICARPVSSESTTSILAAEGMVTFERDHEASSICCGLLRTSRHECDPRDLTLMVQTFDLGFAYEVEGSGLL